MLRGQQKRESFGDLLIREGEDDLEIQGLEYVHNSLIFIDGRAFNYHVIPSSMRNEYFVKCILLVIARFQISYE